MPKLYEDGVCAGSLSRLGFARCSLPNRLARAAEIVPEGVASGDPDSNSVLLWTRYPREGRNSLQVEVAEDNAFQRGSTTANVPVSAAADWTCRVLVGGLKAAGIYWYRFTDKDGMGSRVGRTITAPDLNDPRPIKFAFVSCQNANQGAQNAYRRMIFEDEQASNSDRLGFVLHLGDFIYEMVWYPEDRPQGMYDRRLRDVFAIRMAKRSTTVTFRRLWMIIVRSIGDTCTIRIFRMRAPAGRSSTCGITTSSVGAAGNRWRNMSNPGQADPQSSGQSSIL